MAFQFPGLPSANYDLHATGGILGLALAFLLVAACVYVGERLVQKKSNVYRAFAAGTLGFLAAHAMASLVEDAYWVVGIVLGLLAFCLVTAGVLRLKLGQGVAIGAVAWAMWIVATIVVGYLQQSFVFSGQ